MSTKHTPAINWRRYFSTARVAALAGYTTSAVVCDHCAETTTCHAQFCGTTRCIACEEA